MVYRYRSFADRAHECMRARARCECPAVEANWGWCRDGVDPPPLIIYYGKNPSITADISVTDPFATLTARQKKTGGYLTERLTRACFRNRKGSHPWRFVSCHCVSPSDRLLWLEYKKARLVALLFMFLLFLDFHHPHHHHPPIPL